MVIDIGKTRSEIHKLNSVGEISDYEKVILLQNLRKIQRFAESALAVDRFSCISNNKLQIGINYEI
jgi:hypothetical protein